MPRSYFAVVLLRSPALPIEVIERVIDHLQGYSETLLNCALTHRSLYRHAKMVLYMGTIRVTSRKAYNALVRLRFTADGQTFLARTEGLTLRSTYGWENDGNPNYLIGTNEDVLSRFLVTFAGVAFPNLRILELKGSYLAAGGLWTNLPANTFGRLSKTFLSITVLSIRKKPSCE
ncbi:hypothetical protein DAEQUDRAFT_815793 [Daedalea quercina L-15889]|uniref:F-box domain-containing protein n=1 Tax=Daedalea quercina L-15889 TaxID=1314783 RepID=A0A165KIK5_9APHY|nr:hypothetical protein DAEQUDRAFT_815793 [Daedalea quercina L-15889]